MRTRSSRRCTRGESLRQRSTCSSASLTSIRSSRRVRVWSWRRISDRRRAKQGPRWPSCAQTASLPCSPASVQVISSIPRSYSVADPQVLLVTSSAAPPSAVVPVLAALEAAGMRVRAIDVGAVGAGAGAVADRMRRALMGEGAERKLRKELEMSTPDAAVVVDPHSALALTVARDQVMNPAPVIAVVGELDPVSAWAQTDAARFVAVDDLAALALAVAGVEGERILVVGAIGERAFSEAGATDRTLLRTRFKLGGKVALVEVAGLGAEMTGQLALQLSLLAATAHITFLFDAAGD